MRDYTIGSIQNRLSEYHAIVICRKEMVEYLFGEQMFEGAVLILKDEILIASKYRSNVTQEKIASVCTNDPVSVCLTFMVEKDIKVLHADFNSVSYQFIELAMTKVCVLNDYQENMVIKCPVDEDCMQINAVLLNQIINQWKLSLNRDGSICEGVNLFKSIAYAYGIEDTFVSLCPAANDYEQGAMSRKIKKDGLYFLDCGIRYKGLYSDCTISIKFSKYTDEEVEILQKLQMLQQEIADNIEQGESVSNVLKKALQNIQFKKNQIISSGFGHSVGMSVHEPFSICIGGQDRFKDNMIFTIEPQLFVRNKSRSFRTEKSAFNTYRIESTYTFFNNTIKNYFSTIPLINELTE